MSGRIRRRGKHSWALQFVVGGVMQYRSIKGTKRDAEAELTKLTAAALGGTYVDHSRITVAEFLDRWLDWAATSVSPKTIERYRQIVRLNIIPHIGTVPLQKLRAITLTDLYVTLLKEGGADGRPLSARSVGHVHRVLRRALSFAVTWGEVLQNPAANVKPPRVEQTELDILRDGDVKAPLDQLRGKSLYLVALLGLTTGMRRGEMLALRWQDIEGGKLRVERRLEQTKTGGLRFKSPKTKTSRRSISIPPSVTAELRAHRRVQQERWLALGMGKIKDDGLVLATWNGETRTPNALSKDWSEMMSALGLKITLHSLRHTHASQLIAAGMDVISVSRRLGHASPSITLNVYGHLFSNTDDRAADIVGAALARMQDKLT
jgi:integrase